MGSDDATRPTDDADNPARLIVLDCQADVVALVERSLEGDERAWEALVCRYAGLVNGISVRYGLSEDDRADVFHAVWSALWHDLEQVRHRPSLVSWLVLAAGRESWQALCRRSLAGADAPRAESVWLPEERLVVEERWATLTQAVDALEPCCQQLIKSLFFDPDHPSEDIVAQRLDLSPDSLVARRDRCLRGLRDLIS